MNGLERPTARQRDGFDLIPVGDRASAAPADRSEPCVCGGVITVNRGDSIPETVGLHNLSAMHSEWRWRRSL
jgi:hypothetical protein